MFDNPPEFRPGYTPAGGICHAAARAGAATMIAALACPGGILNIGGILPADADTIVDMTEDG
jgi:hypothetical protein